MDIFAIFRDRKEKLDALAAERRAVRKANARIRVASRIDEVLDPRSGTALCGDIRPHNPLNFPGYDEKLAFYARRTGYPDAFLCRTGTIGGRPVVCAELLGDFMMGSMGSAVGEAVCRSAEYACEHRLPLIIFSASGGARMQEGMFSLMQMAKTAAAIRRLADEGGLFISVLTHPTTGGVTASFASLGDVTLAEPHALIGFAGPRVIEQTISATLPEGFQRAEFQLAHGFVDAIVKRANLRATLTRLLALHPIREAHKTGIDPRASHKNNRGGTSADNSETTTSNSTHIPHLSPQQKVEMARAANRPHAHAFIGALFEDFFELHGDRHFGDDRALLCGIARFEGQPVTVAAHVKGDNLTHNIAVNFGMPHPEGYRTFIRAVKQAEKFGRPVITFIDTPGAYPGPGAEERGQGEAIARCLFTLSALKVPVVAVVTGEGGSGGALALGVADTVIMLEHAVYSILSPEGFATILWKDAKRAPEACEVMKLTAQDLQGFGMVDTVVPEPAGGVQADPAAVMACLHGHLHDALEGLCALDTATLVQRRYNRYRSFT